MCFVFLAPSSFPELSESDLGTSRALQEDSFWPLFALCGSAREVVSSTWDGRGCSGDVSDESRKKPLVDFGVQGASGD